MTAFFVVLLVFSFFIIFLTFSILGARVRIKKSLLNIDYEYYTILLSQRLSAVTYNEIVLDNKFFRKKEWPGYIPESIILKLRSEEHTSELQSRPHLVCRLLLEKKKKKK